MALLSKHVHWHFHDILPRHWHALAMKVGGPLVWEVMVRLMQRVAPALDQVGRTLPQDFPARTWDAISRGMRSQAALFLGGSRVCHRCHACPARCAARWRAETPKSSRLTRSSI
jgi:serine/threonine-protein kinase HipA